jgi:Transcriptional regulator, AbiEi antitoxin
MAAGQVGTGAGPSTGHPRPGARNRIIPTVRAIPVQAVQQFGVFTAAQAAESGWSAGALHHATTSGTLIRLRRGAFALADAVETGPALAQLRLGQQGIAAALRIPAATVSHASAVAVHGLPLLEIPQQPCVTLNPPLRTRDAALHVHRQPIPAGQLDRASDVSLTSVARSCIDLTREFGLAAGLVAADAALHRGLCTAAELRAVYRTCRGRAGLSSGRQIVELLDARSESPLESISRLAMVSLGPLPKSQVEVFSTDGRFIARVDFYWDTLGVVGEADGRQKYTDDALWREKLRQDALTDRGLVVERWGWSVARRPHVLRARLQQAFRRAALLRSAGIQINALCGPNVTR